MLARALALLFAAAALLAPAAPALAQELLSNRSFESPVAPNNGNNIYSSIANWTVVAQGNTDPSPYNIVKPWSGYCCNQALTTPTGGGSQYLDISGTWGRIRQSFTLSQAGAVRIGGWFSTRDGTTALSGSTLYLKNSAGTALLTVAVTFTASDPAGSWKQGRSDVIWLAAGTYYFEAYIPNEANFDLASAELQTAYSLGTTTSMSQCPAVPQPVQGSLAGWNANAPASTITQDGYYDSNWALKYWTTDGIGADLQRLAGQGSSLSFGPGLSVSSSNTVQNIKPANGSWATSVPSLAAAISTGSYVQLSITTASGYEASRLVLYGSANFYTPSGVYKQAAYISTSPTFTTQTELFRDQQVNSTQPTFAVRPLLATGTTYYIRLYFYDVTSTSNPDGTVIWDDWQLFGGTCSSINPTADSGAGVAGTPRVAVANVAANDMVNGRAAVLGSAGNATVARQGTWPAGVTLDTTSGALSLDAATVAGSYTLTYQLCDKGTVPVCATNSIALLISARLVVAKTSRVISDPVNGASNPKAIPGALVRYCVVVANPSGNGTASGISLSDTPPQSQVTVQAGSLRINSSLATAACDFSAGISGGSTSAGTVQAALPDMPAGGYAGFYYDVLVN